MSDPTGSIPRFRRSYLQVGTRCDSPGFSGPAFAAVAPPLGAAQSFAVFCNLDA